MEPGACHARAEAPTHLAMALPCPDPDPAHHATCALPRVHPGSSPSRRHHHPGRCHPGEGAHPHRGLLRSAPRTWGGPKAGTPAAEPRPTVLSPLSSPTETEQTAEELQDEIHKVRSRPWPGGFPPGGIRGSFRCPPHPPGSFDTSAPPPILTRALASLSSRKDTATASASTLFLACPMLPVSLSAAKGVFLPPGCHVRSGTGQAVSVQNPRISAAVSPSMSFRRCLGGSL